MSSIQVVKELKNAKQLFVADVKLKKKDGSSFIHTVSIRAANALVMLNIVKNKYKCFGEVKVINWIII